MPEMEKGKVTEEAAGAALQQLITQQKAGEAESEAPAETEEEAPAETEAQEAPPEGAEGEAEGDDVASLKKHLDALKADLEETTKRGQARLEALQGRHASTERILRDRYLRKASVADNALKILRSVRTESGVAEGDVDRIIKELEGTMHPASASYAAPESAAAAATEDQTIVLNSFLNEAGMTHAEAEEFGTWIRTQAESAMSRSEQAVARQSLDGFLRLAHTRFKASQSAASKEQKRSDVIGAVKSVQRTQREAIRAGGVAPVEPKKQPASPRRSTDTSKLTRDDVSALLLASLEEAKRGDI